MSWRYSSSYGLRENYPSRNFCQAKFGPTSSKFGTEFQEPERWPLNGFEKSRSCRIPAEPAEHTPVWARSKVDDPAAVNRSKDRYDILEEPKREIKAVRRAETKDFSGSSSSRPYGRSLTTLTLGTRDERNCTTPKLIKKPEKSLDCDKSIYEPKCNSHSRCLGSRQVLYMPTATAKLLTRKYSNDLSPTNINALSKSLGKVEKTEVDEDTVTVVTRGTSPTPTTSSIYLRSKRTDFGLEKKVSKPREKPEMTNKEVQTDKEEMFLSKYGACAESSSSVRSRPWTNYVDKYSPGSSYHSRLPRSNCSTESRRDQRYLGVGPTDVRRSTSREESENPTPPESPQKTLTAKPPASSKTPPTSPVKNPERKILGRKSPPNFNGPSPKADIFRGDSVINFFSAPQAAPALCKTTWTETPQTCSISTEQSPTVTLDRCSDISQVIDDVSSASESSEEETTSDEEPDLAEVAMTVKKSVTNFLQNIPNPLLQSQSRTNAFQKSSVFSQQKFNFKRAESGEKAWWMDNADKGEDEARKGNSPRSSNRNADDQEAESQNKFLTLPHFPNRQFSRDKNWLKGSSENLTEGTRNYSPNEDVGPPQNKAFVNGDHRENLDVSSGLRRREFSKSPENRWSEESDHQMKFNHCLNDPLKGDRNFLTDFPRTHSSKNISYKLQNGLGSPMDEKNFLEHAEMSGLITKAKAGLAKSKTKLEVKKSSSRETSPKVTDNKSEIDLYWRELADSLERPLRLCDLDFTDLNSDDEDELAGGLKALGDVPPPPPMLVLPPSAPGRAFGAPAPPASPSQRTRTPATPPAPQILKNKKTVKLFWKEVKDEPMMRSKPEKASLIWDELLKVSIDTQKLEYLFESRAKDLVSKKQQDQNKSKEIIVLDPKRSNAINIGMTKLPPPRAIKAAILKMDSTVVNKEGIEKILSMMPTEDEKLRIQEAQAANPDVPLGSAEQFLLTLTSISELEARLRLWAFKLDFENCEKEICEPLMDLKQGMEILKTNRTFRGILSILLSVGNFLNGYDVKGFQIEYLSKVPEVKDTVHKHSLLHHLCIIVMDKFPESTDLYSEIGAVTRASRVDFDEIATNIKKVEEECKLSWNYLKRIAKHEGHTAMKVKTSDFLADCAERIIVLGKIHRRISSRFRKFAFWLGVPPNRISTTRPHEMFKIISEFALEYRTTRDRVLLQIKKINREKTRARGYLSLDHRDTAQKKMNSKEAKDDARLKELLGNDLTYSESPGNGSSWRRQRRDTKTLVLDPQGNDEEILETLIKTASQVPSSRAALKERRRSRVYGKQSK